MLQKLPYLALKVSALGILQDHRELRHAGLSTWDRCTWDVQAVSTRLASHWSRDSNFPDRSGCASASTTHFFAMQTIAGTSAPSAVETHTV